jgi:hypothetical protein
MKKLWSHVSAILLGLAIGIVVGVKLMGEQIHIEIKKVKNKRVVGDIDTTIPIDVSKARDRKKKRKRKRDGTQPE